MIRNVAPPYRLCHLQSLHGEPKFDMVCVFGLGCAGIGFCKYGRTYRLLQYSNFYDLVTRIRLCKKVGLAIIQSHPPCRTDFGLALIISCATGVVSK